VQFAVTLTPTAKTNAGKKNKDTSGAATERIRWVISYPKEWVGGRVPVERGMAVKCVVLKN
jgi:hypothetical protein